MRPYYCCDRLPRDGAVKPNEARTTISFSTSYTILPIALITEERFVLDSFICSMASSECITLNEHLSPSSILIWTISCLTKGELSLVKPYRFGLNIFNPTLLRYSLYYS